MRDDIKITKLPRMLDSKMIEQYGECPFCNKEHEISKRTWRYDTDITGNRVYRVVYDINKEVHAKRKPFKNRFLGDKEWTKITFRCEECGAEWESPEYLDEKQSIIVVNPVKGFLLSLSEFEIISFMLFVAALLMFLMILAMQ